MRHKDKPKYYSAAQVEGLQAELTEARAAVEAANRRAAESIATYQQQYPAKLQFVYGALEYEKPFLVRSIWHDGQFTYIKVGRDRTAGALRGEGRQAGARSTSRCMRARTACRRCWTKATWRSARSASRSRSEGGDVWPTRLLSHARASDPVSEHRLTD